MYSHPSNKRGVTLIDFEKKFHPPCTFPSSTFIDFLDFPPLHSTFIAFTCVLKLKIDENTYLMYWYALENIKPCPYTELQNVMSSLSSAQKILSHFFFGTNLLK